MKKRVFVIPFCLVLLFLLIVVLVGSATSQGQNESRVEWVQADNLPSGKLVGCRSSTYYYCALLCGYAYTASGEISAMDCMPYKFRFSIEGPDPAPDPMPDPGG